MSVSLVTSPNVAAWGVPFKRPIWEGEGLYTWIFYLANLELQFLGGWEPHSQWPICAGGEWPAWAPFWAATLEV